MDKSKAPLPLLSLSSQTDNHKSQPVSSPRSRMARFRSQLLPLHQPFLKLEMDKSKLLLPLPDLSSPRSVMDKSRHLLPLLPQHLSSPKSETVRFKHPLPLLPRHLSSLKLEMVRSRPQLATPRPQLPPLSQSKSPLVLVFPHQCDPHSLSPLPALLLFCFCRFDVVVGCST